MGRIKYRNKGGLSFLNNPNSPVSPLDDYELPINRLNRDNCKHFAFSNREMDIHSSLAEKIAATPIVSDIPESLKNVDRLHDDSTGFYVLNRTALIVENNASKQKNNEESITAFKVLKKTEDPESLIQEFKKVKVLHEEKQTLGLKSTLPAAIGLRRFSEYPLHLQKKIREALQDHPEINFDDDPLIYCYQATRKYFIYLQQVDNDDDFKESFKNSLHDWHIFLKNGLLHNELTELFHFSDSTREEKGCYLGFPSLLRGGRFPGKIQKWKEAISSINMRESGLADLSNDLKILNEILENPELLPYGPGLYTRCLSLTHDVPTAKRLFRNLICINEYSVLHYQVLLVVMKRFLHKNEEKDGKEVCDNIGLWKQAANDIIEIIRDSQTQTVEVDIDLLAEQLRYWIGVPHYLGEQRDKQGVPELIQSCQHALEENYYRVATGEEKENNKLNVDFCFYFLPEKDDIGLRSSIFPITEISRISMNTALDFFDTSSKEISVEEAIALKKDWKDISLEKRQQWIEEAGRTLEQYNDYDHAAEFPYAKELKNLLESRISTHITDLRISEDFYSETVFIEQLTNISNQLIENDEFQKVEQFYVGLIKMISPKKIQGIEDILTNLPIPKLNDNNYHILKKIPVDLLKLFLIKNNVQHQIKCLLIDIKYKYQNVDKTLKNDATYRACIRKLPQNIIEKNLELLLIGIDIDLAMIHYEENQPGYINKTISAVQQKHITLIEDLCRKKPTTEQFIPLVNIKLFQYIQKTIGLNSGASSTLLEPWKIKLRDLIFILAYSFSKDNFYKTSFVNQEAGFNIIEKFTQILNSADFPAEQAQIMQKFFKEMYNEMRITYFPPEEAEPTQYASDETDITALEQAPHPGFRPQFTN